MSIHFRFRNFILYSGAIWRILTISVTAGLCSTSQMKMPNAYDLHYKKAQLTQGLRATAPSFQDGRQPPSWILSNRHSISRPRKPCLEADVKCIVCTVGKIFAFKLYCDLETGVRGHSRSSKAALFDRAQYDFIFVFHSNYASIYYRFRDIAAY